MLPLARDPEQLTGVEGWAVEVMERLGGPGAGLLIALGNVFPPLPSEIVLPLAGSVLGALVLFVLGRMLPLFRSLVSVPVGVDRMPAWRFSLLTAAGSALWNTAFVRAGYLLGEQWHRVEPVVGWLQWVLAAAVVALVARWLVRRTRARRARAERDD